MENVSFVSRSTYLSEGSGADAIDDKVQRQFLQALQNPSIGDQQEVIVCFHGTANNDDSSIRNILQQGLNPLLRKRQARGAGEYFSTYCLLLKCARDCSLTNGEQNQTICTVKCPVASLPYTRGAGQMLLFAVLLPPRQRDWGMVVVADVAHQMPLGIIRYQEQRTPPAVTRVPRGITSSAATKVECYLDLLKCYARNEAFGFPWNNLLVDSDMIGLKSNVDDQLILQLAFRVPVKVRSVFLNSARPGLHTLDTFF